MQQVRGGVVAAQATAALHVDDQLHLLAGGESSPSSTLARWTIKPWTGLCVSRILRPRRAAGDKSCIADLPARLAVERGPVEGQLAFLAGGDRLRALSADQDRLQRRLGGDRLVSEELVLAQLGGERLVRVGHRGLARAGERAACALLLHQLLERVDVHRGAALGGDHLGEIEREAVGVVQLEGQVSADALRARQRLGEEGVAAIEGAEEELVLVLDGLQDPHARVQQLRDTRRP